MSTAFLKITQIITKNGKYAIETRKQKITTQSSFAANVCRISYKGCLFLLFPVQRKGPTGLI
jgi:hypothetical protein